MPATLTPSELANEARCLSCNFLPPNGWAAAIVLLQQLAGNGETPSQLANSARCYSSCIPGGMQLSVVIERLFSFAQGYLLSAPFGLTVTTDGVSIFLVWVGRSGVYFIVERQENCTGEWVQIAVTALNQYTYTDSDVSPGVTYCYRVTATDGTFTSNPSGTASGSTIPAGILAYDTFEEYSVGSPASNTLSGGVGWGANWIWFP